MARWLLGLCCLGALIYAQRELRLKGWRDYKATQRYEDIYYLPPPSWLKVMSLGHREALADLLWMKALVYFGEEMVKNRGVKHLFEYTDAMLALDPDFRAVYRWVAVATFYRPAHWVEADGWRGISYLERAVKRWPDDGELAWDLGATLAFEMPPMLQDEQQRKEVKARGLEHLAVAARLGYGPPWLSLTNASMLSKLGRTEQAIRHLEEAYGTLTDEASRERVRQKLAQLRSERYAAAFSQAYRRVIEGWQENFPYISAHYPGSKRERRAGQVPDLYLLIGPREEEAYFALLKRGFVPAEQKNVLQATSPDDDAPDSERAGQGGAHRTREVTPGEAAPAPGPRGAQASAAAPPEI